MSLSPLQKFRADWRGDLTDCIEKVEIGSAVIAIVGLGYVGVPLAEAFAQQGFNVIGIDNDDHKIELLNNGINPIHDVSKDEHLQLGSGSLKCSLSYTILMDCDVVIICLPTPVDEHHTPDLSILESSLPDIFGNVKKGACIILESTTFPGTTTDLLGNACKQAGLESGVDVFIGYSPERENPGVIDFSAATTPKLVSGLDDHALNIVDKVYSKITQTVRCQSAEVAEAAKILENVFRCVNISLVNELKCVFDALDIDFWEVIEAASTKPFGFMPFFPGPGIGGHCIPVDPFYLSWVAKGKKIPTRFISLAGEINDAMPAYIFNQISSILNSDCEKSVSNSSVLAVGAAYKKDVGDLRESPAVEIISSMVKNGIKVDVVEPYVPSISLSSKLGSGDQYSSFEEIKKSKLKSYDLIVILTNHSVLNYEYLLNLPVLVYDTRGVFRSLDCELSQAKIRYR